MSEVSADDMRPDQDEIEPEEVPAPRRLSRASRSELKARIRKLEAELDQLGYERRLLGMARRALDYAAEGEKVHGHPAEWVRSHAADVAQRIVDETGHPVTDEPALGPSFREQIAELEKRLAERVITVDLYSCDDGTFAQSIVLQPGVTVRLTVGGLRTDVETGKAELVQVDIGVRAQ